MPLGVGGREALVARFDPDLKKMGGLAAGGIELRLGDARASTHELDLARLDLAAVAHAVLVLQRAPDHVTENFHIAMRVGGKTATWCHVILVDHPQAAEAHLGGIVVIGETVGMMALEPAMVGMAALDGFANGSFHDQDARYTHILFVCHPDGIFCLQCGGGGLKRRQRNNQVREKSTSFPRHRLGRPQLVKYSQGGVLHFAIFRHLWRCCHGLPDHGHFWIHRWQ